MSRFVCIVLSACLLVALQLPAGAAQEFGEAQRDALLKNANSDVLYRIDGTLAITRADFVARKQALQYTADQNRLIADQDEDMTPELRQWYYDSTEMPSDQEILDELIAELVLLAEARALGITVTEQEAARLVDDQAKAVQHTLDNGTAEDKADAQKVMDRMQAFLKGMGLSEAEYRERFLIPTFVNTLTMGAVRQRYIEEIDQDGKMTTDERDARFAEYVDELKQRYPNQPDADPAE